MEAMETQVSLKEIENDLKVGLLNANDTTKNDSSDFVGATPLKPTLNLGAPIVKVFCRVKNGVQFRMVTKSLPLDIKEKLQHFSEVKDQEVTVYKAALDQYGTEYLSPEIIDMINKYANSPLAPLIEFEIEKFNLMKTEVSILLKNQKKEGE